MYRNYDTFEFEGAKTLNGTIKNTAFSTQGVAGGDNPNAVRVTSDAHGLTATYSKQPTIFLQNLANAIYNGHRKILAVATNTFDIRLSVPFAALTPAGTELWVQPNHI